ncbi:MAG: Mur ligase domain-containing protein, partial [Halanaerobiales bacterium]
MKKLTAEFIAKSTAGDLIQGPPAEEILGVSIDSRTIQKGEVFFAIRGERFDGHDFINEAIEKGARALVVDRPVEVTRDIALIKVEDTTKALQDLAKAYRLLFRNLKVIAITGSAGKTTTKDIIAALLEKKYRTRKTRGNLNNFFGLPLT